MSCKSKIRIIPPVLLATLAAPSMAQTTDDDLPNGAGPLEQVSACQSITSDTERLACFDREIAKLSAAVESREIRIVDRDEVKEARRGLFGFSFPRIGLFNDRDDEGEEDNPDRITSVEEPITAFGFTSSGKAYFTIGSGARWVQTDNRPVLGDPEIGELVKIEQAALGSYKANIGSRRAIRVRRVE